MTSSERPYQPLAAYGLIGDCKGAALVSRDGSVDWACMPRFDSPAVFARILDRRHGGFWRIAPTSERRASSMRYLPHTAVLETEHRTPEGTVRVFDALLQPETAVPSCTMARVCQGLAGRVELASVLDLRFDYGAREARLEPGEGGLLRLEGGSIDVALASSIGQRERECRFVLEAGESAVFLLGCGGPPPALHETESLLEGTGGFWRSWCRGCIYSGPYAEHVERSAITLKLLSYAPTGAIIAAPTTSLPEEIGGERNWDYRYSWLRDASLTLYALLATGQRREGHPFLDWICDRVCSEPDVKRVGLQIMYDVGGDPAPREHVLEHLEGYRGSRPVRVGNGARDQLQLDVYGEVLECFSMCSAWGREDIVRLWPHFASLADWVCDHWRDPDYGIWEVRGGPRHFVYSKAMAWVALDRAVRVAGSMRLDGNVGRWQHEATAVRREVLSRGWSERLGAFKQSFEHEFLDAANLLIPLAGLIRPSDPRALANLDRTLSELTHNGLVYRYLDAPDGVAGGEATFATCTFWLVNALVAAGRVDEAVETFEGILRHASPLGLLSEEIDAQTGALLGNFPQGFTHAGLISAAVNLARARGLDQAPSASGAPLSAMHMAS